MPSRASTTSATILSVTVALSGSSSSGATPMAAPTSRSLRLETRLLRAAESRASLLGVRVRVGVGAGVGVGVKVGAEVGLG